jgi:hypothetical protein
VRSIRGVCLELGVGRKRYVGNEIVIMNAVGWQHAYSLTFCVYKGLTMLLLILHALSFDLCDNRVVGCCGFRVMPYVRRRAYVLAEGSQPLT